MLFIEVWGGRIKKHSHTIRNQFVNIDAQFQSSFSLVWLFLALIWVVVVVVVVFIQNLTRKSILRNNRIRTDLERKTEKKVFQKDLFFLSMRFSTCDLNESQLCVFIQCLYCKLRPNCFKPKNVTRKLFSENKGMHTVCCGDEIVVKLPAKLAVVALFCNCWWINCPGEVEFGLMLRVELCAGEFPVPKAKHKINDTKEI